MIREQEYSDIYWAVAKTMEELDSLKSIKPYDCDISVRHVFYTTVSVTLNKPVDEYDDCELVELAEDEIGSYFYLSDADETEVDDVDDNGDFLRKNPEHDENAVINATYSVKVLFPEDTRFRTDGFTPRAWEGTVEVEHLRSDSTQEKMHDLDDAVALALTGLLNDESIVSADYFLVSASNTHADYAD